MMMTKINTQIRYVTNLEGETTDVIIPIELWQRLISYVNSDSVSGLAWMDEQESKAQILADLQESLQEGKAGNTFPVSQLWEDVEA